MRGGAPALKTAAKLIVEQQKVQANDNGGNRIRHIVGGAAVDQVSHHNLGARQQNQGHKRKWNRKAQYNL